MNYKVADFLARIGRKKEEAEDPVIAIFRKRAAAALVAPPPSVDFDTAPDGQTHSKLQYFYTSSI